jgi:hypothetical protein
MVCNSSCDGLGKSASDNVVISTLQYLFRPMHIGLKMELPRWAIGQEIIFALAPIQAYAMVQQGHSGM